MNPFSVSSSTILSEQQASTPCRAFGAAARLLTELYYLGCTFEASDTAVAFKPETPYTHGSQIPHKVQSQLSLHPRLRYGLELLISQGHDVGTAYAWFRTGFKPTPIGVSRDYRVGIPDLTTSDHDNLLLDARHPKWHDLRQATQDWEGNEVVMASVPPRRLWDVVANRVIPYYWHDQAGEGVGLLSMESDSDDPYDATKSFIRLSRLSKGKSLGIWTVSHAWASDMQALWTPVNKYEWPVPLPAGVALEDIRKDLLKLGAEYVWIDVLCLRQTCDETSIRTRPACAYTPFDLQTKTRIKQDEWKIDVPTIGNVYHTYSYGCLRYYSGLGRPFSRAGWDGERHWINRAWTLQETVRGMRLVIGGLTPGQCWEDLERLHVMNRGRPRTIKYLIDDIERKIDSNEQSPWRTPVYPVELILEMGRRHASNEVDKITGLGYIFRCEYLPTYSANEGLESVWGRLVAAMDDTTKKCLLCDFPCMSAGHQWYPTWQQLMEYPKAISQVLMPKLPLVAGMLSEPLVVETDTWSMSIVSLENVQTRREWYLLKADGWYGQPPDEGLLVRLANKSVILPDGKYVVYQPMLAFNRPYPKLVCWEIPGTRKERGRARNGKIKGRSSLRGLGHEIDVHVVKVALLDTSSSERLTLRYHQADMDPTVYMHFR